MAGGEDYFEVFGLRPAFGLDRAQLQKRFYEISRALHPDRFTAAGADARKASLDRMSLLNQAYGALKDPETLREYVLSREGVAAPKPQIPATLAESWFELQDALLEEPESAPARLGAFQSDFNRVKEETRAALQELEKKLDGSFDAGDHGFDRSLLDQLAARMQEQSYLKSMERDISRMSERLGHRK